MPEAACGDVGAQIRYGITDLDATREWLSIREFHPKTRSWGGSAEVIGGDVQLAVRSAIPERA
jgi:hypothetical protein